jgi:hypothetical protein
MREWWHQSFETLVNDYNLESIGMTTKRSRVWYTGLRSGKLNGSEKIDGSGTPYARELSCQYRDAEEQGDHVVKMFEILAESGKNREDY